MLRLIHYVGSGVVSVVRVECVAGVKSLVYEGSAKVL